MKLALNNRLAGRIIGVSMAAAVTVSSTVASQLLRIREKNTSVTASSSVPQSAKSAQNAESKTVIIPFDDSIGDDVNDTLKDDSGKLYEFYSKIAKSEKGKKGRGIGDTHDTPDTETTEATLPSPTDVTETTTTTQTTTQTTSASTEAVTETNTTEAQPEQTVSNGKSPFNYSDVSSIAVNMNQLDDFVDKLAPTSFSWDTSGYAEHGCVQITLDSSYGSVTLDVKPIEQEGETIEPYTINGEIGGTVNAGAFIDSDWYRQNKDCGCGIRSVTWLRAGFAIKPVRGISVGTGLAELTDHYLCVNGGATTLYKAADVITNEEKLNTLLASENAYTFVGGRLYTINGYLDKYYSGRANSYQFADCDMVVQYGCNSIVDHNYISGSWIIEYAIKDDSVAGITFMNKSYYKKREVRGGATSSSTGTTGSAIGREEVTTTTSAATTAAETTVTTSAESAAASTSATEAVSDSVPVETTATTEIE